MVTPRIASTRRSARPAQSRTNLIVSTWRAEGTFPLSKRAKSPRSSLVLQPVYPNPDGSRICGVRLDDRGRQDWHGWRHRRIVEQDLELLLLTRREQAHVQAERELRHANERA